MCGRFARHRPLDEFRAQLGMDTACPAPDVEPGYNISPGGAILLARVDEHDAIQLESWLWGFIPRWARDSKPRAINARAEGIREKPMFRDAFKRQRCLIPADSWYDWAVEGGRRQPYALEPASPIAFAGIWETRETDQLSSCAIITCGAAPGIAHIHHRMPAIIEPRHYAQWLRGTPADAHALLRPYTGEIRSWRVSTYVNRPANNDERCLAPLT